MTKRKSPRHYYVQKQGPSGRFYPIADSFGIKSYVYGWFHAISSLHFPYPVYRLCEAIDGHCNGSDEHVVAEVGTRVGESTLTEFVRKSRDICNATRWGPLVKRASRHYDPPKRPPLEIGVEMPPNFLLVFNAYLDSDADFVVHARTALPRALHEIECLMEVKSKAYEEGYTDGRDPRRTGKPQRIPGTTK